MKDLILAATLFFAREGDVIDGVTVAVDAKPDNDPTTNWTRLGCVEEFQVEPSYTEIKRRCGSPGRYRTRVVIRTMTELRYRFSLQEFDEMTLVELLRNANKPVAGDYVPNSRDSSLRGWIKLQTYDQNDDLITAEDLWVDLSIEAYTFKEGLDPYALKAEVLHSELNSGALTNL